MKFELRKFVNVSASGEEVYFQTFMDDVAVSNTATYDEAKAKALYMLAIEHRGIMTSESVVHSTEVNDEL